MASYLLIKSLHILSSAILLGSGIAIALCMLQSHQSDHIAERLWATRFTVRADLWLTLPAVIIQPLSGAWLVWRAGYDWSSSWLMISYGLYILIGACWLPVVWIQTQLEKMAAASASSGEPLPTRYQRLFRTWFWLGWPAFTSLIAIFGLMVAKPQ